MPSRTASTSPDIEPRRSPSDHLRFALGALVALVASPLDHLRVGLVVSTVRPAPGPPTRDLASRASTEPVRSEASAGRSWPRWWIARTPVLSDAKRGLGGALHECGCCVTENPRKGRRSG